MNWEMLESMDWNSTNRKKKKKKKNSDLEDLSH